MTEPSHPGAKADSKTPSADSIRGIHLGCPEWGRKDWVGHLLPRDTKAADALASYARVFNAVEGNTTFYGLPTEATVERWRDSVPPTFQFCFKFPRTISHDRRLVGAGAEVEAFFDTIAPLRDRLGPCMLQLPPTFGPNALATLLRFVGGLPRDFAYAVEVRHLAFVNGSDAQRRLDDVLRERGIDRVMFDTAGLHAAPADNEEIADAQRRKPALPVSWVITGTRPLLRFIGDPRPEANVQALAGWADVVAEWLCRGLHPYVFMHSANDFFAPQVARLFHTALRERADVGTMPTWPGERDAAGQARQIGLFSP